MVESLDAKRIAEHMLEIGLGALAHANWHANYMSFSNAHWPELSVLQAAHAAELLMKARIAEEHPLLIFERLPYFQDGEAVLGMNQLIEKGRSVQYADLPGQLWATTGKVMPSLEKYHEFGRLRNAIQHFLPPEDKNPSTETAEFIYGVIDPFIQDCWGLFAVDFNEDDEPYRYLVQTLVNKEIAFLVSPEAASDLSVDELDFSRCQEPYRREVLRRFAGASEQAE